ncbi:cupin domain-containing protein [Streptomyces sp. NPDC002130]
MRVAGVRARTPADRLEISAGDVIVHPKGGSGRWDVEETVRKV